MLAKKLQHYSRSAQARGSRAAPARQPLAFSSRHRQKADSPPCRPRRSIAGEKPGHRHGFSTVRARTLPRNHRGRRGRQARALPRNRGGRRGHEKRPLRHCGRVSLLGARLAPLAFLRAAAPAQSPVGLPRSFKPPRPGSPRGRAAWRCDRNTAGSRAPPRRPGRSPARRSTAPPGGSTRGSRA